MPVRLFRDALNRRMVGLFAAGPGWRVRVAGVLLLVLVLPVGVGLWVWDLREPPVPEGAIDAPFVAHLSPDGPVTLGSGSPWGFVQLDGDAGGPLITAFDARGYDLAQVRAQRAAVPRVLVDAVPQDMREIEPTAQRKDLFLRMLLPLILADNLYLRQQRAQIMALRKAMADGKSITAADRDWLATMCETYRCDGDDPDDLLLRVDTVPPSLALAQAIIESGWGTSRFAREGCALFGQWVWGDAADGLTPTDRAEGATHKIKRFQTPLEAVATYIRNLNRHPAYADFRRLRADARRRGGAIRGSDLAAGLEAYSVKRGEYVDLVRQIIATNDLAPFDAARLMPLDSPDQPRAGS